MIQLWFANGSGLPDSLHCSWFALLTLFRTKKKQRNKETKKKKNEKRRETKRKKVKRQKIKKAKGNITQTEIQIL